eukprot:1074217-Pyramimonas_sp.AAC.2
MPMPHTALRGRTADPPHTIAVRCQTYDRGNTLAGFDLSTVLDLNLVPPQDRASNICSFAAPSLLSGGASRTGSRIEIPCPSS